MEIKMSDKKSFAERATTFWNEQDTGSKYGLELLDGIFEHIRAKRDWDALAVFVSRSGADVDNVKRLIKAAFGDRLSFDVQRAKTHPTGVAFKMAWADGDVIQLSNSYGFVREAIAAGKGFRDVEMHKKLKAHFAKPKVDKTREEVIALLAKAIMEKSKVADMGVHELLIAVEAKAETLRKEKEAKALLAKS